MMVTASRPSRPASSVAKTVMVWVPASRFVAKSAIPSASGKVVPSTPSESEVHTSDSTSDKPLSSPTVARNSMVSESVKVSPSTGEVMSTTGATFASPAT